MGLFNARRRRRVTGGGRTPDPRAVAYLEQWVAARRGVEAFVEPRTTVTEHTVVLVAHDGEWTRRRMPGPAAAYALGRRIGIPVYDVALVGYPQRMRDYTARLTREAKRSQRP
ncbi:MAG TPA: oxidoreductase [Pseudonocardiaceae bacterium]|jgi:hypothetical protein|nr:oxidoreductase [Pseudonocardiaceae bacterium]